MSSTAQTRAQEIAQRFINDNTERHGRLLAAIKAALTDAVAEAQRQGLQAEIAAWIKGKGPEWWNRRARLDKIQEEHLELQGAVFYGATNIRHEAGDLMVTLMAFCAFEGFDALEAGRESLAAGKRKHGA